MEALLVTTTEPAAGVLSRLLGRPDVVVFSHRIVPSPLSGDVREYELPDYSLDNVRSAAASESDAIGEPAYKYMYFDSLALVVEAAMQGRTLEIWIDNDLNAQLVSLQLLAVLSTMGVPASQIALIFAPGRIGHQEVTTISEWRQRCHRISGSMYAFAGRCWEAFAAKTPVHWFTLPDHAIWPDVRVHATTLALLPNTNGLSNLEGQILGCLTGEAGIPLCDIYTKLEASYLNPTLFELCSSLQFLADASPPLIAGLDSRDRFGFNHYLDRAGFKAYMDQRIRLTEFSQAVCAGSDSLLDRTEYQRWWGGTRISNSNLWVFDGSLLNRRPNSELGPN